MKALLAGNSTLMTLADNIKGAENFVRDVLGSMKGHEKDCQVRVALDSSPYWPDYQVEFFIYADMDGEEVAVPQTAGMYKGRGHKEIAFAEDWQLRPWSSGSMRYEEVQALIGELRKRSTRP